MLDGWIGPGYGHPTPEGSAATAAAEADSLALDPVYTAKAMAALMAANRAGDLGSGPVLFVHTDGPRPVGVLRDDRRAALLPSGILRRVTFSGPEPAGRSGPIAHEPPLPVAGSVDLDLPVERLWDVFMDVPRWPDWNPCFRRTSVDGGELRPGATLRFTFNPIEPRYPYRLPGSAEIVELERERQGDLGGVRAGVPRRAQLPLRVPGGEPLPLRLVGGGGGADLPRAEPLLAGALQLRVPRVAGRRPLA